MKIMFNLRNIWSDKIFPFPKIKPYQLHREFHWKREERHVLNCKKEIISHIYFCLSGIGESVIFKLFFRIIWQIIGIKYKQESKNSNTYLHTHGMTNPLNHLYNHIFIMVDIKTFTLWGLCNYKHSHFLFFDILKPIICFHKYNKNILEY